MSKTQIIMFILEIGVISIVLTMIIFISTSSIFGPSIFSRFRKWRKYKRLKKIERSAYTNYYFRTRDGLRVLSPKQNKKETALMKKLIKENIDKQLKSKNNK